MNDEYKFRKEDWGHLAERYSEDKPRKLLALDGGGIRGIITLKVLARLEKLVNQPLCEYFDYISGTSTGAIIAGCLAMGMPVKEIESFYLSFGKVIFKPRPLYMHWYNKYQAGSLELKLKQELKKAAKSKDIPDLRPEFMKCLFMGVMRNASTDSVWPISSNPAAKFNDPRDADCNLRIPMWEILRASSAAPTYFPPHKISLNPRDPSNTFAFVDGGTTAYNNPAFLLYRMATSDPYNLRWQIGEKNHLLVSIGTGIKPAKAQEINRPHLGFKNNVEAVIDALMNHSSIDQDINCRTIGRCMHGNYLNYEVGDLIFRDSKGKKISTHEDMNRDFLYLRYNSFLTEKHLQKLGLRNIDAKNLGELDNVSASNITQLGKIGKVLADQLDLKDFGSFV